MTGAPHAPRLEIRHLTKTFVDTRVLDDVRLVVMPGSIHGLLGQNGSGKSTLIKILAGFHTADRGVEVWQDGVQVTSQRAQALDGLAFVHQDLGLVEGLSVMENLAVGRYRSRMGLVDWRGERRAAEKLLGRFDVRTFPDAPVSALSEVQRALVAIARAVDGIERQGRPGLLILDEPTVYLPKDGVDRLFGTMRTVADSGTSVLFVSHQLTEVAEITDELTVLRGGRVTASAPTSSANPAQLVEWIVGRAVSDVYPSHPAPRADAPLVAVRNLSGREATGVDLTIRAGEVLGVTGLIGSGFEEIPYLLYGASTAASGELTYLEKTTPVHRMTPARAIRRGIVMVPGNRARQSVAATLSVGENIEIPVLRRFSRSRLVRRGPLRTHLRALLRTYDVRPPDPSRLMATLSGGNQQKAVVGKWLQVEPRVLLLHEPTQGVDVEARADVFRVLAGVVSGGAGALLASSEFEDVARVCDRVLVFQRGAVVAELDGEGLTPELIADVSYRDPAAWESA